MPGILDSFYVLIGLDPSGYQKGAAEVEKTIDQTTERARKGAEQVEETDKKSEASRRKRQREQMDDNRKVADSYSAIKREALGTFAVLIGANSIKDFVSKSVNDFSRMEIAAKQAGIQVRDLAAFSRAVEANGGDAASAQASLTQLAARLENWRTLGIVDPQTLLAMSRIGAGPKDDAIAVFQKFAQWAQGKDQRLVAQEGGLLGFDPASIDLAGKGPKAVAQALEAAKRALPTDEEISRLKELQGAFRTLTNDIKGNATEILTDLAPALTQLIGQIDTLVTKFPNATKWVLTLGAALTTLGSVKIAANVLKVLGLGGGGAAAAGGGEAAAGVAAAGGAGLIGGGALLTGGLLAVGAYAVHGGTGDNGENAAMDRISKRWWASHTPQLANGLGSVEQRAAAAQSYFVSQGFTPDEARGMVAGMRAENGQLDPHAKNPTSSAFGLGQWLKTRQGDYTAFAKQTGRNGDIHKSSFMDQLAFIVWELRNTETRALGMIRGQGANGAMMAYLSAYMRPGVGLAGDVRRGSRALTQNITVQQMTVTTQATDAKGMARGARAALATSPQVNGTNSGLN